MATITYNFKIGNDNIAYSGSTPITIQDVKYDMSLLSLRYHKKMFQPGKIEAKLLLKQNDSSAQKTPELNALVAYFKTQKNDVMLSKTVGGVETQIAKNYYVFKVSPEYKREEKDQYVQLKLDIYSPDHKLTLDKYCRAYTNQKLVADILLGELNDGILGKAGFTDKTVNGKLIHYLNYIHSGNGGNTTLKEFLQPYLVQYNESFYDFIARTANRCGEFFYYEDGKLYLGLNDFEEKDDSTYKSRVDIDKDTALSFSYEEADDALVGTTELRYNCMSGGEFGQYSPNGYPHAEEVSFDDFLYDYFKKDQFTTTLDELFPMKWKFIPQAVGALLTGGIAGAVAYVAGVLIPMVVFAEGYAKSKNEFRNNQWVLKEDKGDGKQKHASEQYDSKNETAVLYGTHPANVTANDNYGFQFNLNEHFYSFISAGCREVSRHMIRVNIGTQQKPFQLGQKVTFESQKAVEDLVKEKKPGDPACSFDRFIVLEVNDVIKVEDNDLTKEEWAPGQKVVLLPLYSVKSFKFKSSGEVNLKLAIPPVVCPFIRTSAPQRAYVSESNDPSSYGRVCIRYPWQQKDDASSPWIRVATPYAPTTTGDNGGGFVFQHCEGDEVLVDYENGNIEHPYVIGSLFNAKVKAPGSTVPFRTWNPSNHPKEPVNQLTIASRKGHKLMFDDNGNAEDFLRSCLPGLDLIKPLTNKIGAIRFDQDMNSPLSGGLTLTDKWGVYSIACSTTERSIKVESPFGSVGLNAFTGITIHAECGNVSIKGKNVTIEAGNELKLLSGTNISPEGQSIMRDLVAKGIATAAIDKTIAKLVDLTLVRCVIEVLLKPVAGTMTLKSRRYMLIMAGNGSAEIPNQAYTLKGLLNKESTGGSSFTFNGSAKPWKWEMMNDRIVLANTLRLINEQVNEWFGNIATMYEEVKTKAQAFCDDPHQTCKKPEVIIKKAYNKLNSNSNFSDDDFGEDDFKFTPEVTGVQDMVEVFDKADAIIPPLRAITDYCKLLVLTGETLPKDETEYRTYYKKLKKAITSNDIDTHIKDIAEKKETFALSKEQIIDMKKPMKRMLAYKVIEDGMVVEQVSPTGEQGIQFNKFDDFKNDGNWYEYVSRLHNFCGLSVKGAKGAFARFGLEVLDYLKTKLDDNFAVLKMFREKDIWSSAQNGEILFSDKEGGDTLNFVNGALNHTPNEDGYANLVKGELMSY